LSWFDVTSHQWLDALLNTGADTQDTQASGAVAGVNDARTTILNGDTLVLPTFTELQTLYNSGQLNVSTNSTTTATGYGWAATSAGAGMHRALSFDNGYDVGGGAGMTDGSAAISLFEIKFGTNTPSVNSTIAGTSSGEALSGGSGNDVITGNGGADMIYAGAGNDTIVLNASNITGLAQPSAYVNGGTGTDTLKLDGAGILLDFTGLPNKVVGIEQVDLTGTGNNTLKLSLADVIAVSDTHNLYVTGNAGDIVQIKGASVTSTSTSTSTTVAGVTYYDYNLDGTHHLYVQQVVSAVFVA